MIFLILILLISTQLSIYLNTIFAQESKVSVSGFITDVVTGEALIGTNILVYKDSLNINEQPFTGSSANRYGFYVVPSLERGLYIFIFRHIGYKTTIRQLSLIGDTSYQTLNIEMYADSIKLDEVVVEGKKIEKNISSLIDVSPELLEKLPTISGEVDLFKSLEMLPGVNKASDISSGLYVRGGSPDQTLTLVDGVVVYNPAHLGNIASTFNSNALGDVRLIKGAFPAEYGGRLSGVLDIKLKSGTKEKEKGVIGVGLINSFASFEGPLSEKSTYMISGRAMYYDLIQKNFRTSSRVPRYNFVDLNGKITFLLTERNTLSLSALYNQDHAYSPSNATGTDYDISWSNVNLSLNWQQASTKSLFLNSILSFVNYDFSSKIGVNPTSVTSYTYFSNSNLTDLSFRQNAEIIWHQDHTFKMGFELFLHNYNLVYSDVYSDVLERDPYAGDDITSIEASFYVQAESQFTPEFWANYGGRLYYFNEQKFLRFEPRISFSYSFNPNLILKGGFAVVHQFIHFLIRNDITLPTDLWYPSTSLIDPSRSTQFVIGFNSYWNNKEYLLSVEGYYKDMIGLYEFVNNPQLDPINKNIEEQFTQGNGESYGIEFFLNKGIGRLTGWIGYTLSWTQRQFSELNNGRLFYPRYDRRHDISVAVAYDIFKKLNLSATWSYATGQWYTLPPGQFIFNPIGIGTNSEVQFNYSEINSTQFPSYHRLDLNATYNFIWLNSQFETYINLYNVYNRDNPFARYVVLEENDNGKPVPVVKQITLFPFIPSVGIIVKW
ncbi:MAG: TonB-dependent receptor plug domain-containing protein [Ignavibacterium sp.]|nr:MAG: TonB-dependent receptor plug domain-containing protein [Ignavibacterium sp.]